MSTRVGGEWANRRYGSRLSGEVRRFHAGFDPRAIDDLVLWLVSDDLSDSHADTDNVVEWPSRLGPDLGAYLDTGNATFHTGELDGYPSVRTSGVNGSVLISFTNVLPSDATPTLFVVCKPPTTASSSRVFAAGDDNVTGGTFGVTPEVGVRVRGGNTVFDTAMSTSAYQLLTIRMTDTDGDSAEAWIDGTALGVSSSSSQATSYDRRVVLGGEWDSNEGDNIDLETVVDYVEILLLDAQLGDPAREAVESYLLSRYPTLGS